LFFRRITKTIEPMNQAEIISNQFMQAHEVEVKFKGVFPSWHSGWLIDGRAMSTKGVKRLLIPKVMEAAGPDPKLLKQIIWKLLIQCS